MTTYISILRGINVSGKNVIKMDALRQSYEQLGSINIMTYVQSGNVVFEHKSKNTDELASAIHTQIQIDFGCDIPVIVMTIDQLKKIIQVNPYAQDFHKDSAFFHVTFLSSTPQFFDFSVIEAKKQGEEEISLIENTVYLYCPHGYGKTKLTNVFLENKLKVLATTRNWKTTNELLKIAEETKS